MEFNHFHDLPTAFVFAVMICMLNVGQNDKVAMKDTFEKTFCHTSVTMIILALAAHCFFLAYFFAMHKTVYFCISVVVITAICSPYLRKPSKYRLDKSLKWPDNVEYFKRKWSEIIVMSSSTYLGAAIVALMLQEAHMSFLCCMTCLGSTLYHLNRESAFFNFDHTFATAQMALLMWSIYLGYSNNDFEYLLACGVMLPVMAFLLIYCGMPADIETNLDSGCCVRESRTLYTVVHTIWHLVSAIGPLLVIWYFSTSSKLVMSPPDSSLLEQFPFTLSSMSIGAPVLGSYFYFDNYHILPVVPTCALALGAFGNLLVNYLGIAPLD